jgi:lipoprotein-anchoring transpeptidase ErfK/SrfK
MRLKSRVRYGIFVLPSPAFAQTSPSVTTPVAPIASLPEGVIAPDVTVAGVPVGGLSVADAKMAVVNSRAAKRAPIIIVARGARLKLDPFVAGYSADIDAAITQALAVGRRRPQVPTNLEIRETVNRQTLRRVLEWRTRSRSVAARDASISFSTGRAVIRRARAGVEIDIDRSVKIVRTGLITRSRLAYPLPTKRVRPTVTVVPTAVMIDRSSFTLTLYRGGKTRKFGVAVGQSAYPTPTGLFSIVSQQRNPTWTPPNSAWAAGLGPVAPGAGNPLGTRWMGLSSPGIGIHGTPSPWSIGSRASHGCIRMRIPEAETLFDLVSVGTPVFIR